MSERKHDPALVEKAAMELRLALRVRAGHWASEHSAARAVLDAVADDIATAAATQERERVLAEVEALLDRPLQVSNREMRNELRNLVARLRGGEGRG
jgi:hypothetical protein